MRLKITCCKDCQTRTAGCHCPEFMAQKAEIKETTDEIKRKKYLDSQLNSMKVEGVASFKKRTKGIQ